MCVNMLCCGRLPCICQVGQHSEQRQSYGHAMVVDPWGRVLCDLGAQGEGVGVVALDFDALQQVRARMPIGEHRRDGIARVLSRGAQRR